jgi:large subunit ribosomal protein L19
LHDSGIEVMFEMYTPTMRKIEVMRLEKRLDDDLSYLVDALPEYSTFDSNMPALPHPPGTAVPVNPLKVSEQCTIWVQLQRGAAKKIVEKQGGPKLYRKYSNLLDFLYY